jgi:hypothetical protein
MAVGETNGPSPRKSSEDILTNTLYSSEEERTAEDVSWDLSAG